jgi:AraC-like DNA-binding protein
VLEHRVLLESSVARVAAVRCPGGPAWSPEEEVGGAGLVLIRRGVFLRRADGRAALADVTTGYLQRRGEAQQIAHPYGGDVCTSIHVSDELADRFGAGLHVSPAADLAHRRLLAAHPLDRADLIADLIAELLPARSVEAHPLIDEVRALLHLNPSLDLGGLASAVGWSPWHLSRIFHRTTGSTLSAYRRRLRVRAALDELPGSPDLAQLAARVGFADQAHMTRAVRAETGRTPAALRRPRLSPWTRLPWPWRTTS